MLHVLPGDAMLPDARAAALPGELLPWADMLCEGPARHALATAGDWQHRAAWIEAHYRVPAGAYEAEVAKLAAAGRAMPEGSEAVLWFEDDLFCAVNLLGAVHAFPHVAWSLPGPGKDLRERFAARAPLAAEARDFAVAAWRAYGGEDPTALQWLLVKHGGAWPALATTLTLHLRRFPDVAAGLGAPERTVLLAAEEGPVPSAALFGQVRARAPRLGFGDLQVARLCVDLARGHEPLLALDGAPAELPARGAPMPAWSLTLTDAGRACLAGEADRCELNGIDEWLGGVHLRGRDPAWRWDAGAQRLVAQE